ncbi:MAG: YidC/Oxa1 family membrane protein insertase [Oscillospiraceae bacterium]|nr:YidC/Oxa1 family membrane protein insertase [Oscillospiraceae bacterium]
MFGQLGYYICVPFAWLTRLFYSLTGSYGAAIILFTLVVKLVLLPFQLKSKKSMLRMSRMQGKVKEIQTRYANNKEKQQQEISELYAKEGVNPMSGCLWSLIPFPILIALYSIIRLPLRYFMTLSEDVIAKITQAAEAIGYQAAEGVNAYAQIDLAKFIHEHWSSFAGKFDGLIDLDYNFLGMDLTARGSSLFSQFPGGGWPVWGVLLLPIIAAAVQLGMSLVSMKSGGGENAGQGKTMIYLMPLITVWMGYSLPAALCVYWIANAGFSMVQELTLNKYFNKILDREETDKEREKREKRYAKYAQQRARLDEINAQRNQGSPKKKPQPQKKKDTAYASTTENGRVGQRPYARGRAYSEDHYTDE